jgi:hypothetical protein
MESPKAQQLERDLEKGRATTKTKAVKENEAPKVSRFDLESPVGKSWKDKISRK